MLDILIENGTILDGSGGPAYSGHIGIMGGRIVLCQAGPSAITDARSRIDAVGKVVAPGFIDTHTHSDLMLLWDRQHANALEQGVTTEILGQDGMSYAPMNQANIKAYAYYARGCNGMPPLDYSWSSVREYLNRFYGCGINVAYLLPHCAFRMETMGMSQGAMNSAQLCHSAEMIAQGMTEGAKGLSTGLSYLPNFFSSTDELIYLCKTVAAYNGVFAIHLRTVFPGERYDPVDEALTIARRSGVKLHFSHFKTGAHNAGQTSKMLERIDRAKAEGLDISLELYPYAYGASLVQMFLPYWALEHGPEGTLELLRNPTQRARLAMEIDQSGLLPDGVISYTLHPRAEVGLTFAQAANMHGKTPGQLIVWLLEQEDLCLGFYDHPTASPRIMEIVDCDMLHLLSRQDYMVGSDSILVGDSPHPRAWGCFPRLLRLAREKAFPLSVLINRMTKVAAERFGIEGRGELKVGNWADLVVFDPQTVRERASYTEARRSPEGIDTVIVNGKIAVENGHVTGILNGVPV